MKFDFFGFFWWVVGQRQRAKGKATRSKRAQSTEEGRGGRVGGAEGGGGRWATFASRESDLKESDPKVFFAFEVWGEGDLNRHRLSPKMLPWYEHETCMGPPHQPSLLLLPAPAK